MFTRRTVTLWIGIAMLSGMFLMGQEAWPPPGGAPYAFQVHPGDTGIAVGGSFVYTVNVFNNAGNLVADLREVWEAGYKVQFFEPEGTGLNKVVAPGTIARSVVYTEPGDYRITVVVTHPDQSQEFFDIEVTVQK